MLDPSMPSVSGLWSLLTGYGPSLKPDSSHLPAYSSTYAVSRSTILMQWLRLSATNITSASCSNPSVLFFLILVYTTDIGLLNNALTASLSRLPDLFGCPAIRSMIPYGNSNFPGRTRFTVCSLGSAIHRLSSFPIEYRFEK